MKKLLLTVLPALLLAAFLAVSAAEETADGLLLEIQGIQFSGRTYKVVGYTGTAAELEIPAEYNGAPVVSVVRLADGPNTTLRSVTLPASVDTVAAGAFADCAALERVTVEPANPYYTAPDGVLYRQTTHSLCCYPAAKPDAAYTVADGTLRIESGAFRGCMFLREVILPDSVRQVAWFSNCSALERVRLPANPDLMLYNTFMQLPALKTVVIPEGLRVVSGMAFDGCPQLEEIDLPATVTAIEYAAFRNCTALKRITLPDGLTVIGEEAFANCAALTEVTLPDGLMIIGKSAFANCAALTEVTLPGMLRSLGREAFGSCTQLSAVRFAAADVPEGRILNLDPYHRNVMAAFYTRRMALEKGWTVIPDIDPFSGEPNDPESYRARQIESAEAVVAEYEARIAEAEAAAAEADGARAKAMRRRAEALQADLETERIRLREARDAVYLTESGAIAAWERESGFAVTPENETALYTRWRADFDALMNGENLPDGYYNGMQYLTKGLMFPSADVHAMQRLANCVFEDAVGCLYYLTGADPGYDAAAFDGCPSLTVTAPAGSVQEAFLLESGIPFVSQ